MITHKRLPGGLNQQALNGLFDWFGMPSWVKSYWVSIRNRINEIIATGPRISTHQQRIAIAQQTLLKRGDTRSAAALDDEIRKIQDDLDKWWRVKGYIDTYLPEWVKLDDNLAPTSGVGLVPIVLGVASIAALAYVVNVGMALVQDYQFKMQLTQAVIDKKIASGEMRDILSVPKEEGVFEKVVGTVGLGVGIGIPTVLIVGGGLYALFATGMLDTILKTVGLKGGQSQSSST